jgi:hypothetical protein
MNEEFIKRLIKIAQRKTWTESDDFNTSDMSGGNYDDAYYGGLKDGETFMAREVLEHLQIKYKE